MLMSGEPPIMCVAPFQARTSGICGGRYVEITDEFYRLVDTIIPKRRLLEHEGAPDDVKTIARCAINLGWDIAIPAGGGPEDDEMVHGMIIGEEDYVKYVTKHLD